MTASATAGLARGFPAGQPLHSCLPPPLQNKTRSSMPLALRDLRVNSSTEEGSKKICCDASNPFQIALFFKTLFFTNQSCFLHTHTKNKKRVCVFQVDNLLWVLALQVITAPVPPACATTQKWALTAGHQAPHS